ncbi:MAG: hypothetical protein GY811_13675 [Myxococcales bacterium]|nr:hypothetical protein [Myxococcales bacterium]
MCASPKIKLEVGGRRRLDADFSAGQVSRDGGGLVLRSADQRLRLRQRLADCFTDHRRADLVDHTVQELLAQRILGLSLGDEDLGDHDELAKDPVLAISQHCLCKSGSPRILG